jgi:hypothetical protein
VSRTVQCSILMLLDARISSRRHPEANNFESPTLVPVLTSFVPSLEPGAPLRVSIHSWEKPKPSSILLNYKEPEEVILFEAKVYIDGMLMA